MLSKLKKAHIKLIARVIKLNRCTFVNQIIHLPSLPQNCRQVSSKPKPFFMKKILALTCAALLGVNLAQSVPAKPGLTSFKQSDGTTILVQTLGDEFHHSFATADGLTLMRAANGDFYYRTSTGITAQLAHNLDARSEAERAFVSSQREHMTMMAIETPQHKARRSSAPRKVGQTQVPTMGSPRIPIILIEYKDKKMKHDKDEFEVHYNSAAKSAYQYFVDQSNGKYTPQYDIYGIYELDQNRSTYGGNKSNGDDKGVGRMVGEAIDKAGDDIDWSLYDNDGDGEADVCIVVYAGVGEAQASYTVPSSIWPCQWNLSSAEYYGDGTGPRTLNNVTIDRFAVFNEIGGSNDNGSVMDGIGTFCHEFSHCLGLPDFYETTYGHGYYGMGYWSLMNSGCYNDDGNTPIGYSAYEKNFMSWINLIEPTEDTYYTLPVFNSKSEASDQAIKITSHLNSNEFFILENRAKQGWDQYIDDEGILITHFTYIPSRWENNTVNNEAIQLATIIPADGTTQGYSEDKDLYGERNHEFSPTSTPASKLNMKANGQLANTSGGAGHLEKPVTEIILNHDKTASFWYMKAPLQGLHKPEMLEADNNHVTETSFRADWTDETDAEKVTSYTLWVREHSDQSKWEKLYDFDFSDWQDVVTTLYGYYSWHTEINDNLDDYGLVGWSGDEVYSYNGYMQLGYSKNYPGLLQSPTFDLSDFATKKVTVVTTAKFTGSSYYGSNSSTMHATVFDGDNECGTTSQALSEDFKTYTLVIDGADSDECVLRLTIENDAAEILDLKVYAGDYIADAEAPLLASISVEGNDTYRIIEGITDKNYVVENLKAGGTFNYKVKTTYIDNSVSEWSNVCTVILVGGSIPGDVNADGVVDIADINAVINVMLGKEDGSKYGNRADVNGDGGIDISDVNTIINIMLNN